MGNKNDARKRRKRGQIKFKTRSFKGNKHTNSLLNSSSVTLLEQKMTRLLLLLLIQKLLM